MNNYKIHFILLSALVLLIACKNETEMAVVNQSVMYSKKEVKEPIAAKKENIMTIHGKERNDPYYWMRLSDEQKNAATPDSSTQEVLDYLNAENDYTSSLLKHTEGFQKKLFDEIVGRIKQTDMTVPFKKNGYMYATKYEEGKEYPIYARHKGSMDASEEVMLNGNDLSEGFDYYNIGGRSVSPDNKLLAYGEDTLSRRIYELKFKDLESGKLLNDVIPGTTGSAVWANDNRTVFYTLKDEETLRSYKIMKHIIGTDVSSDVEMFTETDETFYSGVYKTKSEKYIVIYSGHTLTNEYHVLDADAPDGDFTLFETRDLKGKHEFGISHFEDKWYIRTNLNAPNFKLMETSVNSTSKENWKEVIPHRKDVLLEGMDIFSDYLVLSERENGLTQLRVRPNGNEEHYIDFPKGAYLCYTSTNPEFNTDVLRIGYQSMTTPNTIYDYNMKTQEKELLKQQEVVGDFNSEDYASERVFVTARDGAKVPVSIVYAKTTKLDGNAPCLLYAYGSYGSSMDPYFSSTRLTLLNRGFVFAIAHIRGGMEMGKHWYEDGKLLKKKNTFTDFVDCGEYLKKEGYAKENGLFAAGGSAGGLLMGAVVNMRPDLWAGVMAAVPFVDVVTTMLDETIPLTTFEWDEWGNPKNEEYYDYMLSYSPYDNVEAKNYPPLLVTTGLFDSQVQYWEPAKWVAKLRDKKTDDNPLLLHCNMSTGHGGASGRFERHKETALEYAFLLDLAGVAEEEIKG